MATYYIQTLFPKASMAIHAIKEYNKGAYGTPYAGDFLTQNTMTNTAEIEKLAVIEIFFCLRQWKTSDDMYEWIFAEPSEWDDETPETFEFIARRAMNEFCELAGLV